MVQAQLTGSARGLRPEASRSASSGISSCTIIGSEARSRVPAMGPTRAASLNGYRYTAAPSPDGDARPAASATLASQRSSDDSRS
jgi:hypothetical protein